MANGVPEIGVFQAAAQAELAEGAGNLAQAELQIAERQSLIDQLAGEVVHVRQQRDHLQDQLARRQIEIDALRAEHTAIQAHVRVAEDRAHQQVDQARPEVKTLGQQQERARQEHANQVAERLALRDTLQAAVRSAEQAAAQHAGRVDALEATIAKWQDARKASEERSAKSPTLSRPRRRDVKNPIEA